MIVFKIPKGDLDLPGGTTAVVRGAECARQRIQISLNIFLGEWFLDLRIGMPYFRDVLIHSPNSDTVRSVIKKGIMNTPGIVEVSELEVALDTAKRVAAVTFVAIYADGTAVPGFIDLII